MHHTPNALKRRSESTKELENAGADAEIEVPEEHRHGADMRVEPFGSKPRVVQTFTTDGTAPVTLGWNPFKPQGALQAKQEQMDGLSNDVHFRAVGRPGPSELQSYQ